MQNSLIFISKACLFFVIDIFLISLIHFSKWPNLNTLDIDFLRLLIFFKKFTVFIYTFILLNLNCTRFWSNSYKFCYSSSIHFTFQEANNFFVFSFWKWVISSFFFIIRYIIFCFNKTWYFNVLFLWRDKNFYLNHLAIGIHVTILKFFHAILEACNYSEIHTLIFYLIPSFFDKFFLCWFNMPVLFSNNSNIC